MGLFDSFQRKPQQQQQQPQAPQQQQQAQEPSPWTSKVGGGGESPDNAGWTPSQQSEESSSKSESPLDMFKDLWQPSENQQAPAQESKIFSFDPSKMGESIGKMNFAGSVNPDIMQKALQGDTAAFGESLNSVARTVFGQSLQLMTNMMEHRFKKHNEGFEAKLPDMMRNWGAGEELNSNPLFQHPGTRPMLEALKSQIASKHPELPAKEVARTAELYFEQMSEVIQGAKQQKVASNKPKKDTFQETDFSDFLD